MTEAADRTALESETKAPNSKFVPKVEVKAYQRKTRPETKKQEFIKEISKVLSEIEQSKKSQKVIYFSYLYKKPVVDSAARRVGLLKDLAISGGERFPEVSHILVENKTGRQLIPWNNVKRFNKIIVLNEPFRDVEKRAVAPDDVFLGEHILDKQVVDVNGLKLIRVNDIALTYIKNRLAVVNIDVGTKSIFRRLGFEKLAEMLPFNISDHPVSWESIEPLAKSEKIHLKVPCARVSDLHPADVAELFDELSLYERNTILRAMKSETAAKVLLECEPEVQKSIIRSLKIKRIASIFEKMHANDVANLLTNHAKDMLDSILKVMEKSSAEKIQKMLAFEQDAAARYMSESFVEVEYQMTAEEAIEHIRKLQTHPNILYYVYAVDENKSLCGVVSLKKLILAAPKTRIIDIMTPKPISVEINDPIEYVGELIEKYDLMAIPVIDVYGRINGVINIDDILDIVLERIKTNQPIELSGEEKEDLIKEKRMRFPFHIIRDVGQFLRYLDTFRPKKK